MSKPGKVFTKPVVLVVSLVAFASGFVVDRFFIPEEPHTEALSLSPQGCVTECQSRQTDCLLDCEGREDCQKGCLEKGRECFELCVPKPPEEAPVEPSTAPKNDRPDAGAGGSAN